MGGPCRLAEDGPNTELADTPSYHDIQRFLGLVQYIQQFIPNVSTFTVPLPAVTRSRHDFMWQPLHKKCFTEIKALATEAPILKSINLETEHPIRVQITVLETGTLGIYAELRDQSQTAETRSITGNLCDWVTVRCPQDVANAETYISVTEGCHLPKFISNLRDTLRGAGWQNGKPADRAAPVVSGLGRLNS